MADNIHRAFNTSPTPQLSGDSLQQQTHREAIPEGDPAAMNARDHPEMPPGPSYPSPNSAQMNQGGLPYYTNQRQLTADELRLSAELSRETSTQNMNDGTNNGMPHGQTMVLASSNPAGPPDMGRPPSSDQHHQHQQGQQQIIQFTPNQQVGVDPNHDLSYGDQSARRKRTKVSRACDECRRKKIRCDATSESGVETCTNCRRSDMTCQFSRVPMKRGPSKGYIKELAERINSLENQANQVNQAEMQYPAMTDDGSARGYQELSPPIDGSIIGRKRTISMSEGVTNAFMQQRTNVWPGQPGTENAYSSPLLTNGSAKVAQPFWSQDSEVHDQAVETTDPKMASADGNNPVVDIDEKSLDMYYQRIQPILPSFPHSRDRLRSHLQKCSREVQEVFLHALYAVTGTDVSRVQAVFQEVGTFDRAQEIVYGSPRQNPASRPVSENLVWCQILILMVLDADSRGPENFHGQNGIPKSVLIDMAFNVAHHVAKGLYQLRTSNPEDGDLDSDANIARRNWSVVGVLSRWHAVSVAGLDNLGTNEVATPEDRKAFGLVALQLARYSTVMSEVSEMLQEAEESVHSQKSVSRALRRNMYGQLNRIGDVERLQLEGDSGVNNIFLENLSPLVHWFITLLLKRHLCTYNPSEILESADNLVGILQNQSYSSPPFSSPFHLHAQALSALTLLEITDIPELANDAWGSLEKLSQLLERRDQFAANAGELEDVFATPGWNATIRSWIEIKLNKSRNNSQSAIQGKQQGQNGTANNVEEATPNSGLPIVGPTEQRSLEHLADLAVGAGGGAANASSPPGSGANAAGEEKDPGASGSNEAPATSSPNQQARVTVDFTRLTSKGYLNVFAGLL